MLPAEVIAEIIANLAALNLQPSTVAAVLGALAPLLRTTETPPPAALELPARSSRRLRAGKRARGAPRRKYHRRAPTEAHDRALAALKANPDGPTTDLAKMAKCSRSTVLNARAELEKEVPRAARRAARETSQPAKPKESRERAQQFLKDTLARGPKLAADVEDAAEKAHVGLTALDQARADLGIVTSRSNAGGAQAVQWSLPG